MDVPNAAYKYRGNGLSPWAKGVKLQLSIQSTSHVSYKLCDYQMIMRCKRGTHFNTPAERAVGRRGSLGVSSE